MDDSKSKKLFGTAFSFASWWVCILGATFIPQIYQAAFFIFFAIASLLSHYFWALNGQNYFWIKYLIALIVGIAGDYTLFHLGFMSSQNESLFQMPYWLICMWIVFPLNFGHAFQKIVKNMALAIPFGVVGAPLAYKAGPKFEILSLHENALFAISLFWGCYMLMSSFLFNYSTKKA